MMPQSCDLGQKQQNYAQNKVNLFGTVGRLFGRFRAPQLPFLVQGSKPPGANTAIYGLWL